MKKTFNVSYDKKYSEKCYLKQKHYKEVYSNCYFQAHLSLILTNFKQNNIKLN